MKKQRNMGNKGFSLVELIIVIAIMAILVGVIGSQAIPYLEKSRAAKDLQTLDTMYTAFQSAIIENEVEVEIGSTGISELPGYIAATPSTSTGVAKSVMELLGKGLDDDAEIKKVFKSKKAKKIDTAPVFSYKIATGEISVTKGELHISSTGE
ncbi:MAG: prepilin-type N-terminal cleavage/methylation domain-containing protein [Acetivibrio sp.]